MRIRILIGFFLLVGVPAIIFSVRLKKARVVKVGGRPVVSWALQLNGPTNIEAAEKVFQKIGPEAVPNLIEALESNDSIFKKPLRAVAPHLPDKFRIGLFRMLSPEEAERLRLGAASALAILGAKATSAVPVLGKALSDDNAGVSLQAAVALGKIGQLGVPELVKALNNPNHQIRLMAIHGLTVAGSEADAALPALTEAMEDKNADVRVHAFLALGQIRHPASVSALAAKLNHVDPNLRLMAARGLGGLGPWARDAIPMLIVAAKDGSAIVRSSAVVALGKIRPSAEPVVNALIAALSDPDRNVRLNAAEGLGHAGPAAAPAVPKLIECLKEEEPFVRAAAATALGSIGAQAGAALPALAEAAKNPNELVRTKAEEALAQIRKRSN
ncbi:MAG: HEAT repeat domain-containing protein [Verrucomicrobia bacterium]|nr:HEAT repeat domain-containing protein [Verrucomicrobiota bacterium]